MSFKSLKLLYDNSWKFLACTGIGDEMLTTWWGCHLVKNPGVLRGMTRSLCWSKHHLRLPVGFVAKLQLDAIIAIYVQNLVGIMVPLKLMIIETSTKNQQTVHATSKSSQSDVKTRYVEGVSQPGRQDGNSNLIQRSNLLQLEAFWDI